MDDWTNYGKTFAEFIGAGLSHPGVLLHVINSEGVNGRFVLIGHCDYEGRAEGHWVVDDDEIVTRYCLAVPGLED